MQSISTEELYKKITAAEDIQLIDVREPWEHELFNIGGDLIPLGSLLENIDRISTDKPVIFYCQKGIRSQVAIQRLSQKSAYNNFINLNGGMAAWQKDGLPAKG